MNALKIIDSKPNEDDHALFYIKIIMHSSDSIHFATERGIKPFFPIIFKNTITVPIIVYDLTFYLGTTEKCQA